MIPIIRYGNDSLVKLDPSLNGTLSECGSPRSKSLLDCSLSVRDALASPLGYPPLADITTEDDRIVLAVGNYLPQAAEIVAAAVQCLSDGGVRPEGITVLQAADAERDDVCRLIPDALRQQIRLVRHDPQDRDKIAYLATTEAGEPIFLNRLLTDADFVLPIGCVLDADEDGYFGINSSWFPAFSDEDTQARFRASNIDAETRARLVKETDEAGWLLGASFSLQVVPAAGDGVLHVIAGEIGKVSGLSRQLFVDAWHHSVAARVKLVVATIEGGPKHQTWRNLARALANAATLVEEDGAVAVLCELDEEPGPAIRQLAQSASREEALRDIRENPTDDSIWAAQIAETLERNHLYLMSKLDGPLLEELEIVPIESHKELNRLLVRMAQNDGGCIILSNAANAKVAVRSGDETEA